MWPVILAMARTYAPYVVLPIATVIGVIGYNLETSVSDRHTPANKDSVTQRREDRRLEEDASQTESLKELKIPKTIFEKNTSPGLEKNL